MTGAVFSFYTPSQSNSEDLADNVGAEQSFEVVATHDISGETASIDGETNAEFGEEAAHDGEAAAEFVKVGDKENEKSHKNEVALDVLEEKDTGKVKEEAEETVEEEEAVEAFQEEVVPLKDQGGSPSKFTGAEEVTSLNTGCTIKSCNCVSVESSFDAAATAILAVSEEDGSCAPPHLIHQALSATSEATPLRGEDIMTTEEQVGKAVEVGGGHAVEAEEEELYQSCAEETHYETGAEDTYATCVDEPMEEEAEAGKEEAQEKEKVATNLPVDNKPDGGKVQKMGVVQANSYVSEASEVTANITTNSSSDVSAAEASVQHIEIDGCIIAPTLSTDTADCACSTRSANSNATHVSHQLESMMMNRIQAIDSIRHMLEHELEQDNGLLAEYTDKVMNLEKDVVSKNQCIEDLNKHMTDLTAKNGDCAKELSKLSFTIKELVESNQQNITRMVELEQDIATKKDTIEEMADELQEKTSILDKNIDDNTALKELLESFKQESDAFKATVEDLEAKNADYADELENLLNSLKEMVDHNTELEAQVEQLMEGNAKLDEDKTGAQQKNAELLETVDGLTASLKEIQGRYDNEVEDSKRLTLEVEGLQLKKDDMKASMARMEEDHKEVSAEKATLEDKVTSLEDWLEEVKLVIEEEVGKNTELQEENKAVQEDLRKEREDHSALLEEHTSMAGQMKTLEEENEVVQENLKKEREDHSALLKERASMVGQLKASLKETVVTVEKLEQKLTETKGERDAQAATIHSLESTLKDIDKKFKDIKGERDEHAETISSLESIIKDMEGLFEEKKKKYHAECEKNERLKLDRDDMEVLHKNALAKMTEEHITETNTKAALQQKVEASLAKQLEDAKEEIANLTKTSEDERTTTAEVEASLMKQLEDAKEEIANLTKTSEDERTTAAEVEASLTKQLENAKDEAKGLAKDWKVTAKVASKLEKKLAKDTEDHQAAMSNLMEDHDAALAKTAEEHNFVTEEHNLALSKLTEEHNANIADLTKRLKDETQSVDTLKQKVEKMRARLQDEEGTTTKIAKMHATAESKLHKAEKSNKKERTRLKVSIDNFKQQLAGKEQFCKEVQESLTETEEALAETESNLQAMTAKSDGLSEKLEDMNDRNALLNIEVGESKTSQAELLNRLNKLLGRLDEKDDALTNANNDKSQWVEKVTHLNGLNGQLQTEIEGLKDSVTNANNENSQLVEKITHLNGLNDQLQTEIDGLKYSMAAMGEDHSDLQAKLENNQGESLQMIGELNKRLNQLKSEINHLKSNQSQSSTKWLEEKKKLKMRVKEGDRALVVLSSKMEKVQEEKESIELNLSNTKEGKQALEYMLEQLKGDIQTLEQDMKNEKETAESNLFKTTEEKQASQRELDLLQEDIQSLACELDETKAVQKRDSYQWMEEKRSLTTELLQAKKDCEAKADAEKKLVKENDIISKEMDNLIQINKQLSVEVSETRSILDGRTIEISDRKSAVNELTKMNRELSQGLEEEKQKFIQEKQIIKKRLRESEKTLVMVTNQKTTLESQKTKLESRLAEELIAGQGKHTNTIAQLQERLEDNEHLLESVKDEKDNLQSTMRDLQASNQSLCHKISEYKLETSALKSLPCNYEKFDDELEDKENKKKMNLPKLPKKSIKGLALDSMKPRRPLDNSVKSIRPPSRPRASSRPTMPPPRRQPLSPAGSVGRRQSLRPSLNAVKDSDNSVQLIRPPSRPRASSRPRAPPRRQPLSPAGSVGSRQSLSPSFNAVRDSSAMRRRRAIDP